MIPEARPLWTPDPPPYPRLGNDSLTPEHPPLLRSLAFARVLCMASEKAGWMGRFFTGCVWIASKSTWRAASTSASWSRRAISTATPWAVRWAAPTAASTLRASRCDTYIIRLRIVVVCSVWIVCKFGLCFFVFQFFV